MDVGEGTWMGMGPSAAIQLAASFTWLGMVLAISFLEAPLKFRAPGITVALGVGIGRLVFRVLNRVEAVFAVVLVLGVLSEWGATSPWTISTFVGLCVVLLVQAALLRPLMDRRVAAGRTSEAMPRTSLHVFYIVLECVKVVLLVAFALLVLSSLGA